MACNARNRPIQAFAIAATTERLAASAARTTRDTLADLAGESVGRITAEAAFKANLTVLKTTDEMYASLLDILA